MSVPSQTLRGTSHRGQGRGTIPFETSSPSHIPRPRLGDQHQSTTGSEASMSTAGLSGMSTSRQKQNKRDEVYSTNIMYRCIWQSQAIRKKMEADLNKKKHGVHKARQTRKAPPGTVLSLKPSPALQIKPSTTVAEAAQLWVARKLSPFSLTKIAWQLSVKTAC